MSDEGNKEYYDNMLSELRVAIKDYKSMKSHMSDEMKDVFTVGASYVCRELKAEIGLTQELIDIVNFLMEK